MGSIPESPTKDAIPGIIDIRTDADGINIMNLIKSGLNQPDGVEKTLPTLLLYDNKVSKTEVQKASSVRNMRVASPDQ